MDHLIDDEDIPRHERELTLSTGSILAIFLGLVVICGAFFGFGYNMGRKSAPTPLNMSEVAAESTLPTASPAASKPAAGSPMDSFAPVPAPTPVPKPARRPPVVAPSPESTTDPAETTPKVTPAKPTAPLPAPIVREPSPVAPTALSPSATASTPGGSYMVQVAAVSHQEDAQLLVGALRARGYSVSARNTGADSFIHVQVGPFHDKKEADAMRQRLLTDGYNAIVK